MIHVGMGSPNLFMSLRACLHGGGGSQVGEVTHLGGVTCLSMYNLSFYLDYIYMIGGVTCQGRLPGLLGGVTLSGNPVSKGDSLSCKRLKGGNPLSRGRVHGKKLKS